METLKGLIADFDNAMVVNNDVSYFGPVRRELIDSTKEHGELIRVEVLIGGYNDDPRSLYEVPEVRRWVKKLVKLWPDALLWLTPASLWYFVLSLNPKMFSRQADGQLKIEMDLESVIHEISDSMSTGAQTLRDTGMAEDALDRVFDQGLANIKRMIGARKFLEDYNVVHPKDGEPFLYADVMP
jgi:hypothetical protein